MSTLPVDGQGPGPAQPLEAGAESLRGRAAQLATAPRVEPTGLVIVCAPSWASGVDLVVEGANFYPRILEDMERACIPPDIYVRLGETEGWGRQPVWTHFDGYLIRTVAGQARLQALAGGDVRYGGLYELLAVGREYDSDRLLARLAVVQRARMAAW